MIRYELSQFDIYWLFRNDTGCAVQMSFAAGLVLVSWGWILSLSMKAEAFYTGFVSLRPGSLFCAPSLHLEHSSKHNLLLVRRSTERSFFISRTNPKVVVFLTSPVQHAWHRQRWHHHAGGVPEGKMTSSCSLTAGMVVEKAKVWCIKVVRGDHVKVIV